MNAQARYQEVMEADLSFLDMKDFDISEKILEVTHSDIDDQQKENFKKMLQVFAEEVVQEKLNTKNDFNKMINERISEIDELLTEQINKIIHHAEFQKLEASWRGLEMLINNLEPDDKLKIRVLDATKDDILLDHRTAPDWDQSGLFKLVYESEYGTFGGEPFGMLVGDYYCSRSQTDIEFLRAVSLVASAAHVPFISAAGSKLFDMDSFTDLSKPKSLERMFNSVDYANWNTFRSKEESKYVCLAMPSVIMRNEYSDDGIPVKEFKFVEDLNEKDHEKFLWGNAAFYLADRIGQSYRQFGWFQNIRGVENGGTVDGLPIYLFTDEEGNRVQKNPVEVTITDRREKELDDLGFLSLVYKRGTDQAVFFGSKTIHKLKEYDNDLANANASLTIQMPYIMAISRFAHYLKSIMRDKIGSFSTPEGVSAYLNNWISRYVILSDTASDWVKSAFPLREARIDVSTVPGKPGVYSAVMYLRPHFYLNELTISMRLVSELPAGK
ncbi:type VI secretion system contractile sheath large subunit [Silvanigrella paludirubra]|jgi:type VI secretion system protein ImpC|uniref:Type VI secretion system contractile sheath large subunit n=1 Tax=Silvanigrella paludirubra TaxID=2499159 RepID=A0A6N6VYH5_9BACT|nr:type VI secretion system contractile sheath large subunit [Silvanigrella paludirubra]KAB8039962.1 type VI secretion system contractile sheath large subunit [Silvanigrella paludirubra]